MTRESSGRQCHFSEGSAGKSRMSRDLQADPSRVLEREVTTLGREDSVSLDRIETIFAQIRMRFGQLISRAASKS